MATLDSPIILVNINEFITKKTCARLFAVSKIMKNYLKLKQFKLLDTSDLSKIKMIINSDLEINFMIFIQTFKIFRYTLKSKMVRFHIWNEKHWNLVVSFLIYRYIFREYQFSFIEDDEPFMFKYQGFIKTELIECIYSNFKPDMSIFEIYNFVKKFANNHYRELILL